MLQSLWQKYKKSMLIPGVLIISGLFFYFSLSSSDSSRPQEELIETIQPIEETIPMESTAEEAVQQQVFVDIKGAVMYPGVYELQPDKRIFDAIQLAGGYIENADTQLVNHAQKVQDEMVIYIPIKGEQLEDISSNLLMLPLESQNKSQKINVNTADAETLATLPGIGPSKAHSILSYREEKGRFQTIDDVRNINGIGDKTFEKIKDSITVK
ncbi:helix-hairpin-helix domain-containing protein [Lysinibacillus sp. fkY74-1]|uniref:helix-hairpin-helix domain-containing protein n=1 Tax=Lysinibacillus TaxID=400634 RepID=UPI0004DF39D4|nr:MULTISPECIES: helix-hairpin-helix domain-containing protein [Lysinibacillus]MBG9693945.1 competence protein ComEA [Lysinibacillus sphaericus]MBG9756571.1 competence protein ComEA [Lysinibacillus sphaericus]MBI6862452.1 helix-hairpin-helix domain-containing protein [Lysinibacillus fusiformis]QPA53283.1 helix-hairpin-helix domain-containing protein [Lysinibacillus sphaericus]QPA57625.1 helix-hairpin-helix domain-containing protein [Lysinibacillus sphaericus]